MFYIFVIYCFLTLACATNEKMEKTDSENEIKKRTSIFSKIETISVEVDVNLILLGFDHYNKDFSSLADGILEKLSDRKIQRFLKVKGDTIQENAGSHIEYKIHYHFISVHSIVQLYIKQLMESYYRDVDINLTNVKVINPYEIKSELDDLFLYISKYSQNEAPNQSDLILVIMNTKPDIGGKYGFSTEFSYAEMQKMIDEIFKNGSEFAISDFIFPLTEPLAFTDDFESSNDDLSDESDVLGLHGISQHPILGVPIFPDINPSNYCILDWRELSFSWAHEKYLNLKDQLKTRRDRSSLARVQRNLKLLHEKYNKKEMKRILVEMKQILNNDFIVNDELINMIEGTHAVSDYIFIDNLLLMDVAAGPFEWGSIHDDVNIRTKSSLLYAGLYEKSLISFTTINESFLNYIEYVKDIVSRSCKVFIKEKKKGCLNDVNEIIKQSNDIKNNSIESTTDYIRMYSSLIVMERDYKQILEDKRKIQLNNEEMEVVLRISRSISDFIAHFVTPPYVISSETTPSEVRSVLHSNNNLYDNLDSRIGLPSTYHIDNENIIDFIDSEDSLDAAVNEIIHETAPIREKIHFQVNYLTRSEFEDVFTVDDNYFDYGIFRSEVERLKLPSQDFYFSFQEFKLENEPRLQLAVLHAMTSTIVPHLDSKHNIFPVQQPYINSSLLLKSLRARNADMPSRDIQIYIFCMIRSDSKPVLIDKSQQVVYKSDGNSDFIFAVQNEKMSSNSPYFVNNVPMHYNLHNIMPGLLSNVFEMLSHTKLNLYFGEKTHTNISPLIEDCIYRCIGSVDPIYSANTVYSGFHIEIMKRSKFIIRVQLFIDEFNQIIDELEKETKEVVDHNVTKIGFLRHRIDILMQRIMNNDDIQSKEDILREADFLLSKLKHILYIIHHLQIVKCKTRVADIQYVRLFARSFVLSILIAIISSVYILKSKKKYKEM